jgi:hypothetical protein
MRPLADLVVQDVIFRLLTQALSAWWLTVVLLVRLTLEATTVAERQRWGLSKLWGERTPSMSTPQPARLR